MNKQYKYTLYALCILIAIIGLISIADMVNNNLHVGHVEMGKAGSTLIFQYTLEEYFKTDGLDTPVAFKLRDCTYKNDTSAVVFSSTIGMANRIDFDLQYDNITNKTRPCIIEMYINGDYYESYRMS